MTHAESHASALISCANGSRGSRVLAMAINKSASRSHFLSRSPRMVARRCRLSRSVIVGSGNHCFHSFTDRYHFVAHEPTPRLVSNWRQFCNPLATNSQKPAWPRTADDGGDGVALPFGQLHMPRYLDQSIFSDPASLFDCEWVISGLKLYQRSLPDCLGSNIRLEGRCVGIDLDSAGQPAEIWWFSGPARVLSNCIYAVGTGLNRHVLS